LNATIGDILRENDVRQQFEKLGVQVDVMNVNGTANFIASERVRWGDIIKSANVTVD
jgi:hypothetical protein